MVLAINFFSGHYRKTEDASVMPLLPVCLEKRELYLLLQNSFIELENVELNRSDGYKADNFQLKLINKSFKPIFFMCQHNLQG